MKTVRRGVNDASTRASPARVGRTLDGRCAAMGAALDEGEPVLDLLYAGVVIVVFAILLLAVRGLDRL
ncbi:hypothetical protein [Actinomycetospora cinnamomea]|uniref:Uncharacterized protein n=1 Tax=Actinomycetospora cinnamomea TaxID=663609 RepID=A0A2U1FMK1_9PSEU|nr:hypothetical protein [Actinomycetospora cinnamomea]PVZ13280.1 hypothetical protein C8D89_102430 [Actinomycetospora cinnamomea]